MINPVLNSLLEELRSVCINIVTYNAYTSEDPEEYYMGARRTIEEHFEAHSLPTIVYQHRTARQLRKTAQSLGGYEPRRDWVDQSFDEKLDHLERLSRFTQEEPSSQPEGLPDYFHPDLLKRCQISYLNGEYANAVFVAFRLVEVRVRELAELPTSDIGTGLIGKAMGKEAPILKFSAHPAEQEAAASLFRGALGYLKNPLSHHEVEHPDRGRALERLAFASMLLHELDNAQVRSE